MGILDHISRQESQQLCFRIVNLTGFSHVVLLATFWSDKMAFSKALLFLCQGFLFFFFVLLKAYSCVFSLFCGIHAFLSPEPLQGFDSLFYSPFSHNPYTKWVLWKLTCIASQTRRVLLHRFSLSSDAHCVLLPLVKQHVGQWWHACMYKLCIFWEDVIESEQNLKPLCPWT